MINLQIFIINNSQSPQSAKLLTVPCHCPNHDSSLPTTAAPHTHCRRPSNQEREQSLSPLLAGHPVRVKDIDCELVRGARLGFDGCPGQLIWAVRAVVLSLDGGRKSSAT